MSTKNNDKILESIFKRDTIIASSILPLLVSIICLFINNDALLRFKNSFIPILFNITIKCTFCELLMLLSVIILYSIKQILFYNEVKNDDVNKLLLFDKNNFSVFKNITLTIILNILFLWLFVALIILFSYKFNIRIYYLIDNPLICLIILVLIFIFILVIQKKFKKNHKKKIKSCCEIYYTINKILPNIIDTIKKSILYIIFAFFALIIGCWLLICANKNEVNLSFNENGIITIKIDCNIDNDDIIIYQIFSNANNKLLYRSATISQINRKDFLKYSMLLFKNNDKNILNNDGGIANMDMTEIIDSVVNKNLTPENFYDTEFMSSYCIDLNKEITNINDTNGEVFVLSFLFNINDQSLFVINNFSYENGKYIFTKEHINYLISKNIFS